MDLIRRTDREAFLNVVVEFTSRAIGCRSQLKTQFGRLAAPGDCFEMPAHFRIGVGALTDGYQDALDIFRAVLAGF